MTNQKTPSIAVADRIAALRNSASKALACAYVIKGFMDNNAVVNSIPVQGELNEDQLKTLRAINSVATLERELTSLVEYYDSQKSIIEGLAGGSMAAEVPTPPALAPQPVPANPAPVAKVQDSKAPQSAQSTEQRLQALATHAAQQASEATAARAAAELRKQQQAQKPQQEPLQQMEVASIETEAAALPQPVAVTTPRPAAAPAPKAIHVASAYDRLVEPELSPLTKMFAPSAWFPEGVGEITIGSNGFGGWHEKLDPMAVDFGRQATLPNGFYGSRVLEGDVTVPAYAVVRNNTTLLIWDFKLGNGCGGIHIFQAVAGNPVESRVFRPAESCSASCLRTVLDEIKKVWGASSDAIVIK